MTSISKTDNVCTVVVTVDAPPDLLAALAEHARLGVERHFPEYPGFVSGALHVSADGGRLVQYLQWESEAQYRACLDDPRWDELATTPPFREAVRSGAATLDARVYHVVAAAT